MRPWNSGKIKGKREQTLELGEENEKAKKEKRRAIKKPEGYGWNYKKWSEV